MSLWFLAAVFVSSPVIFETLQHITEGTGKSRAIEASGIKGSSKFTLSLVIYKTFSMYFLQAESLDLGSAVNLIQATIDIITAIRSECH